MNPQKNNFSLLILKRNKKRTDINKAKTPPNLFGIERKIA